MKNESIFILYNNGTMDMVPESVFNKINITNVYTILIPYRVYDGFCYIPVDPSYIPNLREFTLLATIVLDEFEYRDDMGISRNWFTEIDNIELTAKTIPDFYRIVASLYAFNAINDLLNANYAYDFYALFGIHNPKTIIKYPNYKVEDGMQTSSYKITPGVGENVDSISYYIRHLERLLTVDSSLTMADLSRTPDAMMQPKYSSFTMKHKKWIAGHDCRKGDVILMRAKLFGYYIAVDQSDIDLINKFHDVKLYFCIYQVDANNGDYIENPTVYEITELCEVYEKLYDYEVQLFDTEYVLSVLSQLKYIMKSFGLLATAIFGTMHDDILFNVSGSYRDSKGQFSEYSKDFQLSKIDDYGNLYTEILNEMQSVVEE